MKIKNTTLLDMIVTELLIVILAIELLVTFLLHHDIHRPAQPGKPGKPDPTVIEWVAGEPVPCRHTNATPCLP